MNVGMQSYIHEGINKKTSNNYLFVLIHTNVFMFVLIEEIFSTLCQIPYYLRHYNVEWFLICVSYRKFNFDEFVANVLHDNIGHKKQPPTSNYQDFRTESCVHM